MVNLFTLKIFGHLLTGYHGSWTGAGNFLCLSPLLFLTPQGFFDPHQPGDGWISINVAVAVPLDRTCMTVSAIAHDHNGRWIGSGRKKKRLATIFGCRNGSSLIRITSRQPASSGSQSFIGIGCSSGGHYFERKLCIMPLADSSFFFFVECKANIKF